MKKIVLVGIVLLFLFVIIVVVKNDDNFVGVPKTVSASSKKSELYRTSVSNKSEQIEIEFGLEPKFENKPNN